MTQTDTEKEEERNRMMTVWRDTKDSLYKTGLDSLDSTAQSMINLSSALVTVGFTVTGTLMGANILQASNALWFSFVGFFFFMCSTISAVLVVYRRPLGMAQDALPREISSAWNEIVGKKYEYLKLTYFFFTVGIASEIAAIFSLII